MKMAAEILLFTSVAMNAALLAFIAGVLRKVMDEMNAAGFKTFVGSLVSHSKKSPFMLTILNAPFVGAILFHLLLRHRRPVDSWGSCYVVHGGSCCQDTEDPRL